MALVALGLSAVPAAAGAAPHSFWDPTWLPDGKSIAFVDHDGFGDIWVMRDDGTGLHRLTASAPPPANSRADQPDWSPDGTQVAFRYGTSGGLSLMDADGSHIRPLAGAFSTSPAWSPSGRKIAFARGGEQNGLSIFVMAPGGRQILEARPPNARVTYLDPSWSPDGTYLAFTIGPSPDEGGVPTGLGIVRRPHGKVRRVLHGYRPADPDWSPDGRTIVFSNFTGPDPALGVLTLSTGRVRSLGPGWHPRYSPDGRRIVFNTQDGVIWVMHADGSSRRPLTH
jgi:Tol biopolymer transport system component